MVIKGSVRQRDRKYLVVGAVVGATLSLAHMTARWHRSRTRALRTLRRLYLFYERRLVVLGSSKLLLASVLTAVVGATAAAADRVYNVMDYGAQPDGMTLCTAEIQQAIDTCAAEGGGVVRFPRRHVSHRGHLDEEQGHTPDYGRGDAFGQP